MHTVKELKQRINEVKQNSERMRGFLKAFRQSPEMFVETLEFVKRIRNSKIEERVWGQLLENPEKASAKIVNISRIEDPAKRSEEFGKFLKEGV